MQIYDYIFIIIAAIVILFTIFIVVADLVGNIKYRDFVLTETDYNDLPANPIWYYEKTETKPVSERIDYVDNEKAYITHGQVRYNTVKDIKDVKTPKHNTIYIEPHDDKCKAYCTVEKELEYLGEFTVDEVEKLYQQKKYKPITTQKCVNCGAVLKNNKCDYCETEYL